MSFLNIFSPWIDWLKEIITGINTTKEEYFCECGYKFKLDNPLLLCKKCIKRASYLSIRKVNRLKRKLKREPGFCPICMGNLKGRGLRTACLRCPKCEKFTYVHYQND